MRAVIQRVTRAEVRVDGATVGKIAAGLCVLVGVARDDAESDAVALAAKVVGLRIFEDGDGKMNRDVLEAEGSVLAVSQFTLLGDVRKGGRDVELIEERRRRRLRVGCHRRSFCGCGE